MKACRLDPDSVTDRSSGVSVPVDPRLDSDSLDADADEAADDSSVLRCPLLCLGVDDGDGPSSSPAMAPPPPPTQQNRDDFQEFDEAMISQSQCKKSKN